MFELQIPAIPLRYREMLCFPMLTIYSSGPSGNGMLKPLSSDISSTAISASESSPATSQLGWWVGSCSDRSRMVKYCHRRPWTSLLIHINVLYIHIHAYVYHKCVPVCLSTYHIGLAIVTGSRNCENCLSPWLLSRNSLHLAESSQSFVARLSPSMDLNQAKTWIK